MYSMHVTKDRVNLEGKEKPRNKDVRRKANIASVYFGRIGGEVGE